MAKTKIEWTESVWNPVTGCTKIAAGCKNCYAARMANRLKGRCGYPADDPFRVTFHPERLAQPLKWKKPRHVFVCSMGDLFHEDVPDGYIMDIWRIMGESWKHKFQILTKRPERMRTWLDRWADTKEDDYEPKLARGPDETRAMHKSGRAHLFADMMEIWGPPPEGCAYPTYDWIDGMIRWPTVLRNVWLGTSASTQADIDRVAPPILETPAAVRFLSLEPMLGPIDLSRYLSITWTYSAGNGQWHPSGDGRGGWWSDCGVMPHDKPRPNWIIVGSESGPKARPCDPENIRSIVQQCQQAQIPVFIKQIHLDGNPRRLSKNMAEWPEDLRVREIPK